MILSLLDMEKCKLMSIFQIDIVQDLQRFCYIFIISWQHITIQKKPMYPKNPLFCHKSVHTCNSVLKIKKNSTYKLRISKNVQCLSTSSISLLDNAPNYIQLGALSQRDLHVFAQIFCPLCTWCQIEACLSRFPFFTSKEADRNSVSYQ